MKELLLIKKKRLKNPEQKILEEANKITSSSFFHSAKILAENYELYYIWEKSLEEGKVNEQYLFSEEDIKELCIRYRLIFKQKPAKEDSVPYPALLALEVFNRTEKKKINTLYLCTLPDYNISYKNPYLAFIKTTSGKYFLLYASNVKFPPIRKIKYFPIRSFETVLICVIILAATLAVTLPTRWIWLPEGAPYWGTYRIAAFFHILIFLMGFTTYGIFSFSGQLNSQLWNKYLK